MILASKDQIKAYTGKGCWVSRTLIEDFEHNARQMPDRTAVVDPLNKEALLGEPPDRVTYADFARAVDGTATALMASGIGKDDIVLVQLPNCWELAMLYLAIAKTGAVISPAPLLWRSKELTYVAELTEAKAMITVEIFHNFDHLSMAKEIQQKIPSLKHLFSYADLRQMTEETPDPRLNSVPLDANDIFTICWTSGTEAQPKGCPLSHNNWRCQSELAVAGGMQPKDVLLTAGPLVNMGAVGTVLVPWLILGGTIVLHHPFEPKLLLQQLVEEKVNYTLLVPAVLNLILKHPEVANFDLSAIRTITVGSAPPSLWSMEEFKKRWNIDIGNIWGQNEGTGFVSGVKDVPDIARRVDQFPRYGAKGRRWSIPVSEFIQTKIVDPLGNELTEDDAVGELLYKGPNIIAGYFRRPDLNEKAFDADGFLKTGDLFQIKGDLHVKFFDRAKDIIIRGGLNISAQEVENMILAHPDVQDAAAIGMPDENLGERTCVYVVPNSGRTVTLESVVAFMKERGVAVYKFPERLEIVETIPRNPVGKILKKELRKDIAEKLSQNV
jgi:non-ribosomal peptide synthetase component E (peptide arylation enzyme)